MNRNEFLRELQNALENSMGEASVRENVRYYSGYIEDEIKKGRSEEEVIEELGDPWLIAKTLSDAPGGSQSYDTYESSDGNYVKEKQSREQKNNRVHVFSVDKKWKVILLIVALVAVMMLIFSILTGIIALLTPVIVPILMIVIVIRILSNRNR